MKIKMKLMFALLLCAIGSTQVRGKDHVNSIKKDLSPFETVTLNGNFNVSLVQGTKEHVVIIGREKNLGEIEILEMAGHLTIQPKKEHPIKSAKKVDITLYYKTITKLELNGIGELVCKNPISGDKLDLDCNGIKGLDIILELNELDCVFNGIGSTYLQGNVKNAEIEFSGVGNLFAFDLITQTLDLETSGIGRMEVHAQAELKVEASGIGSVHYLGNPAIKKLDGSGIGRIKRVNY